MLITVTYTEALAQTRGRLQEGADSSPFSGMITTQRAPSHRQLTHRPMQAFLYNMLLLFTHACARVRGYTSLRYNPRCDLVCHLFSSTFLSLHNPFLYANR